ncbi:hypothetical protein Agub_g12323 [Astrephomene gubernaculifera]|uniref:Uncharacterized protein n=1 Tax=Astrephomene gubernaculifera TaxID=47775 RepID=A0AAD3DYF8_9CHLO|nr:hypothetical protein Agub_g12323 [Astrephomene gubernaculifera]
MMAAANAAARVAARAAEETKRNMQKGETELTLRGLPTGGDWDWRALKKWLQSRGLAQRSIKYTAKEVALDVGVVRFASEAECSTAADLLATAEPPVRGTTVTVEKGLAPEYANKQSRKRGREGEEEAAAGGAAAAAGGGGRGVVGASRGPKAPRSVPDVCEAVCPWWRVPYPRQLSDKHQRIVLALRQITAEVDRRTYGAAKPEWVRAARGKADSAAGGAGDKGGASSRGGNKGGSGGSVNPNGGVASGLCCPLLGILRAPAIERYRNKSEFTAGLDEAEQPSVGFLRGAFQDGITCVGSPAATRHTSRAAVALAAAAAEYIRGASAFPVYDKRRHEGYWRLVLVREGSNKTFLPVPQPAPAPAPAAEESAAAAAAGPVLENPTFASLDPFTYLVTFEPQQQPAAEAAAAQEAGAAAAAAEEGAVKEEVMEEAAAAAAEGGSGGAAGMHVSQVSEAEAEQPPPDEVMVMLQVNPQFPRAQSDPAAAARELRAMTAALRSAASAAGLPLTTVRVQYHAGVSNAAPYDAPITEVPSAEAVAAAASKGKGKEEGEKKEVAEEAGEVEAAVVAASGPGFIHDSLCELKFRISPTAFFQVNSPATCVLYKVVGEWAAPSPATLLLDICCGTGTIGLTMAGRVAKVVGVDSVASAVEDARVNAALNGITNATFVTGKAEDALPGILATYVDNAGKGATHGSSAAAASTTSAPYDNVVAVCDPPRAGLHRSVIRALLGCEKIRRLVFVSCNPDNLVANISALCYPPDNRSGREKGGTYVARGAGAKGGYSYQREEAQAPFVPYTPFRPVKAVAVDLFPHTSHVEAVMLLER